METTTMVNTATTILDKGKLFIKAVVIFFMALGLWIPAVFIKDVIREREGRQREAIIDISSKWAGRQTISGPLLMIPYLGETKDDKGGVSLVKKYAWFMPDKMETQAAISPEVRHRGIYDVTVYRAETIISGRFNNLKWDELNVPAGHVLWNEAVMVFTVSDNIRGINEDVYLEWDGNRSLFNPLPAGTSSENDGLAAPVTLAPEGAASSHSFSLKFTLNGTEGLLITAGARENTVKLSSSWNDPSFTGVKLPDERTVTESGFTASWKYMNRSIPLVWKDHFYNLGEASFGVQLITPVDGYDKTERSVKYALLCIILTFASFFLIESIYKKPLHLVQYGLAGLALVLFYTLLLSISEYLGFNLAYLIAGVATISLVTWFVGGIMKSSKLAFFIGFVLTVVYGYIFSIIQLQDFALLMGSIGLFIALAIIMFFSRKLQW